MAKEESFILAVDTATVACSVALTAGTLSGGRVAAEISLSSSVTQSRRLLTSIDWLLKEAGVEKEQISGYACGLGPGSFTGLRIGMATVKGLVAASGKPLYGASTLDVLAASCPHDGLICVVLDARKKEVYTALYRSGEDGAAKRVSPIEVLPPERLAERIDEPVLMIGDGLLQYGDLYRTALGDKLALAPASSWRPSAAVLGLLAGEMARENRGLNLSMAVPLYVRASDAELNLGKQR